ncbi:MAG: hypothetical protein AAB156_03205, partial [Pseudomonadota bacterium]
FVQHLLMPIEGSFLGFGGIDDAKFRGAVVPPCRVILVGKIVDARARRFKLSRKANGAAHRIS